MRRLAPKFATLESARKMSILYDPDKLLRRIMPEGKIKKMLSRRLDPKRAALSFIDNVPFLARKDISKVAVKTLANYRERVDKEKAINRDDGRELEKELATNPRLLIQRVQNAVVYQVSQEIKETYHGELYEWLPSDAEEPDPEHQLNYGKIFEVGVGEMPGERYGCRCAMRLLVNESELKLGGGDE